MEIPNRIIKFISENEVMSICTAVNNIPYCATVFYVFEEGKNYLAFMSDKSTRHIHEAMANNRIAGTIISKNVKISKVIGIQFMGILLESESQVKEEYTSRYMWAYPMATLSNSNLWVLKLIFIKLTDFRLGFGKKIIWNNDEIKFTPPVSPK